MGNREVRKVGDVADAPVKNLAFETIFDYAVAVQKGLHHSPDSRIVFREIPRSPGGIHIVADGMDSIR